MRLHQSLGFGPFNNEPLAHDDLIVELLKRFEGIFVILKLDSSRAKAFPIPMLEDNNAHWLVRFQVFQKLFFCCWFVDSSDKDCPSFKALVFLLDLWWLHDLFLLHILNILSLLLVVMRIEYYLLDFFLFLFVPFVVEAAFRLRRLLSRRDWNWSVFPLPFALALGIVGYLIRVSLALRVVDIRLRPLCRLFLHFTYRLGLGLRSKGLFARKGRLRAGLDFS